MTASALPMRGMLRPLRLEQRLDLPVRDESTEFVGAADEYALHEYHRERRPPGPHLERVAPAPSSQVAAVLEVQMRNVRAVERLAGLARKRILLHADDHDVVLADGSLDLAHDVDVVGGDRIPDCRMDVCSVENVATHDSPVEGPRFR